MTKAWQQINQIANMNKYNGLVQFIIHADGVVAVYLF